MTSADAAMPHRWFGRAAFVMVVTGLLAAAVVAARVAERALGDGEGVPLGLLELRLAYNTGVAFNLGDTLPPWVIVAVTGGITLLVVGYGWHAATRGPTAAAVGLGMVAAGAAANVLDRVVDGRVTDYFHTGWFPTFNLPDVYITCGVVLLVASAVFTPGTDRPGPDHDPMDPAGRRTEDR